MTRTFNAASRIYSPAMAQSSRLRKSLGTYSVDINQRKGQNSVRLFNTKIDLDADFSLKKHTGMPVDEVEEASEGSGRHPRDTSATEPPQVRLVDFLVAPRKLQRGNAPKDGDFEVVPHVRPVIVLEDNVIPELDIDEPWEHVSLVEEHPVNALSYSKVTSLN